MTLSGGSWRDQLAPMGANFNSAASSDVMRELEHALGLTLPTELRALLAESDGLGDRYQTRLVWPAAEIGRQNREFRTRPDFRTLYMPFDALLFFGEAGNGDQFFYRILGGEVRDTDIYEWEHETDSRVWRAPGLMRLLHAALNDTDGA